MSLVRMLDAAYPPAPAQWVTDMQAVGANAGAIYVYGPYTNYSLAHVQTAEAAGIRVLPIIVPGNAPPAPPLYAAAAPYGITAGPLAYDIESGSLPGGAWVAQAVSESNAAGWNAGVYGNQSYRAEYSAGWFWLAEWPYASGVWQPVPGSLPVGALAWQYAHAVGINGNQYDISIVDDAIWSGGKGMPVDQHLVLGGAVHGKIMTGAVWYNWGDAAGGSLVPVQGFAPPPVGQDVTYFEAVLFGGQWVDRIGPAPGQGDWGLLDSVVDTVDVSGCADPPSCEAKLFPPTPPPPSGPTMDEFNALKAAFEAHKHDTTVSGTSGVQHQ